LSLAALVVVIVGGILVLRSLGYVPDLNLAPAGSNTELSSSRLRGSDGVRLPETTPPDWWWTRVVVDEGVAAPTSAELGDGRQYSRVLIPTDVLFEPDSSTVSEGASSALRDIAATITSPEMEVIVVCHSSRDGSVEERKPLSEARAREVASILETLLLRPEGSIERIGMGDEQPLPGIDQTTESGLALNRRCEVFIGIDG
jgi:outer membrane protein OmpA-like peptidoglycan-associated protein